MKLVMMSVVFVVALTAAGELKLPPSTTLQGAAGKITWTVKKEGDKIVIDGKSPRWKVHHEANVNFTPIRTEREGEDGVKVTIVYTAKGAIMTRGEEKFEHEHEGLWDADSVDIRLGATFAANWEKEEVKFTAIDTDSGKTYEFLAERIGEEQCRDTRCVHVELGLAGWFMRKVGPSWEYWFAPDGQLIRFEAKWGKFGPAPKAGK